MNDGDADRLIEAAHHIVAEFKELGFQRRAAKSHEEYAIAHLQLVGKAGSHIAYNFGPMFHYLMLIDGFVQPRLTEKSRQGITDSLGVAASEGLFGG